MALQLCRDSDVEDWWSEYGVENRLDDDRSGSVSIGEGTILTRLIERASAVVAAKLSQRYSQASYAGSNPPTNTPMLVVHFAAVVAAYFLGVRRNLPVGEALKEEYEKVMSMLDAIQSGAISIPEVPESFETTPFLTNFHVDGRYRSATLRKVRSTSVGADPPASIKSYPENSYPFGVFGQ